MSEIKTVLTPQSLEAAVAAQLRKRMAAPHDPPPSAAQTIERARQAVRKVDLHGQRGITLVTMQEVEAMALMLVVLGLRPYGTPKGD